MHATRIAALTTFLLAGTALAQDAVWNIVPQSRTQVIAPDRRVGQVVSLKEIKARADIRDTVSATTITMTIANSGNRMEEAQVLIPVPEGAAIRDFQLEGVGGPEPSARILPRDEARKIYDAIVAASRDPGLLEFVGTSVIKSSVFPVPARGEQVVKLTYEHMLPADTTDAGTRIDYALPRTDSLQASGADWSFSASFNSKRHVASIPQNLGFADFQPFRRPGRICAVSIAARISKGGRSGVFNCRQQHVAHFSLVLRRH